MISSYISLTKPRICILVLVTTYLGYYIGLRSVGSFMLDYYEWITFVHLIIGQEKLGEKPNKIQPTSFQGRTFFGPKF